MDPTAPIRALDLDDPKDVARGREILGRYLETTADEILEAGDPAAGDTPAEVHEFLHRIMPDVTDPVSVYGPDGCVLLVAGHAGALPDVVGCVGITPVDAAHTHPSATERDDLDATCEMNRLYVAPEYRGRGLARALIDASRDASRAIGYRRMILDVVPYRTGAIALYRSAGFRDGSPVVAHPICTVPLECNL